MRIFFNVVDLPCIDTIENAAAPLPPRDSPALPVIEATSTMAARSRRPLSVGQLSRRRRARIRSGRAALELDGRSSASKRYREIARTIKQEMSSAGNCTGATLALIDRFAAISVLGEYFEAAFICGDCSSDVISEFNATVSSLIHVSKLLERCEKPVSLQYLERRRREQEQEQQDEQCSRPDISMGITYGYARASTRDPNCDEQAKALKAVPCVGLVREKTTASGLKVRPALHKLMKQLKPCDTVVVTKLDRLGRSTRELLELIESIGKTGAFFKSLGDPLFDTTTPSGRLLSPLLAAIVEFERDSLKERTSAGRIRARYRGVKFGPKFKLTAHQRAEALKRLAAGEAQVDIARSYNIDPSRISRLARGT